MPFQIIREDIREIKVDAVVDPTDSDFSHSGGTDEKIHRAAGQRLAEYCDQLERLKVGDAVISPSFGMKNCKYIIHTYGPTYIDGKHNENQLLYDCYKNALDIATSKKLETIAFPLISSGTFGFPKGVALKVASNAITDYLFNSDLFVYLLVYDDEAFDTSNKLFVGVEDYIKKHQESRRNDACLYSSEFIERDIGVSNAKPTRKLDYFDSKPKEKKKKDIFRPDVSFGEYLVMKIDEKGLKDSDVYNHSNMSKQLFNDIKNNRHNVKKENVCALAFGLQLNVDETIDLLNHAGYTLSKNNTFDLIVRYCLENKESVISANLLLYKYDQTQLGARNLKSDKKIGKRKK